MSQTQPTQPVVPAEKPKSLLREPQIIAALIGLVGVIIAAIGAPLIIDRLKATPTPIPATPTVTVPSAPAASGFVCPGGDACIKANISLDTGEKIYHFPGCKYYDQTIIDLAKGERSFITAAEAEAAGWKKAIGCP
jgi:hypothetical protein